MRAATPTLVAEIPFIVRRAGGLEAGEAPWRRTAFRTRGFFPSRRERTRRSSAYQPAVEARNRTAAPRDCLPPRGPRSEPTWSFRRISPAPARMRRRSGNWQSARKTPGPPPTARVPGGRPWSSMLQNSSRQLCGSPPQPSFILLSLPRLGFHNPSLRHTGVIYVSLMDLAGRNVQFISRPRALTEARSVLPQTGMPEVIPTRPLRLCLGRGRRACKDAGGNHRTAQQRDQRRALGSDYKGAVCEFGRGADADDSRRVRDLH